MPLLSYLFSCTILSILHEFNLTTSCDTQNPLTWTSPSSEIYFTYTEYITYLTNISIFIKLTLFWGIFYNYCFIIVQLFLTISFFPELDYKQL